MSVVAAISPIGTSQSTVDQLNSVRAISNSFGRSFSTDQVGGSAVNRSDDTSDPQKLHQKLEAMLIAQMLKGVITDQMAGEFGDGIQGDFFSSVFTKTISEKLVENGNLSLAPSLKP